MTTGVSVRVRVTKIVLVLAVSLIFLVTSSLVGLDNLCMRQNGTVCYRRAPEGCRFHRPELTAQNQNSAVNHDALIRVTIRMNFLDPLRHLRYFKLEWMQASGLQSGPIFVRVSPLAQGHLLQDQVICLSNLAINGTVMNRSKEPDLNHNGLRQSILVPPINNATASLVEAYTGSLYTEILVVLPEYRIHSFILQGVSITIHNQTAYISLSRPDSKLTGSYHRIVYTLTLQCFTYIEGDHFSNCEDSSKLNISPNLLAPSLCSDVHKEIILIQNTPSPRPIAFEMTHPAYDLRVDAKLIDIFSGSDVGTANLITPKFGCVAGVNENASSANEATGSITWTTLNVQQIKQDPDVKSASLQVAPVVESSVSVYPEKDQNATTNSVAIILGVCLPFAALILVVTLILTKRLVGKRNSNTVRQNSIPEKYDGIESSKANSEKHYVALESPTCFSSGRKPKLRSDCCRISDISSIDNLVPSTHIDEESSHQKYNLKRSEHSHDNLLSTEHNLYFQRNKVNIELMIDNLPVRSDGVQDIKYTILVNGKTPQKQSKSDLECDPANFSHDCIPTLTDSSTYLPIKQLHNQKHFHQLLSGCSDENQSHYCSSELRRDWNSMPSIDESQWQMEDVIKPKLFVGPLKQQTMIFKCMEINQRYEDFVEHGINRLHLQSSEVLAESECYSICESVVC